MAGKIEVEVNFPEDMSIIEKKLGEALAQIILKKYGPEKARLIGKEVLRRSKELEH